MHLVCVVLTFHFEALLYGRHIAAVAVAVASTVTVMLKLMMIMMMMMEPIIHVSHQRLSSAGPRERAQSRITSEPIR